MNVTEEAKIVPGAWSTIKKRHAARCATDSKFAADYVRRGEKLAEQQTRSLARTLSRGGKRLRDLCEIPGFCRRGERSPHEERDAACHSRCSKAERIEAG